MEDGEQGTRAQRRKQESTETETSTEEAVPTAKRPKVDEDHESSDDDDEEGRDPGKAEYKEFSKALRALYALTCDPDLIKEDEKWSERLIESSSRLKELCGLPVGEGEIQNPFKLLQIHLKHTLLTSEKIKGEENVKTFLCGLEDGSAGKSDEDDSVYVFLANYATELWYQWNEEEWQWYWTPDRENHMPCSSDVVTEGQWKGETPAPENVEIIAYLDALRPIPSDEQYITSLEFDILQVLESLVTCGEAEAEKNAREALKLWRSAVEATNHNNRHVLKWIKWLDHFDK